MLLQSGPALDIGSLYQYLPSKDDTVSALVAVGVAHQPDRPVLAAEARRSIAPAAQQVRDRLRQQVELAALPVYCEKRAPHPLEVVDDLALAGIA